MSRMSIDDQVKEAQREVALRKRVYPGLVKRQQMTEGQAAYHLAAMEAIVATLKLIKFAQEQIPLFPLHQADLGG